jgi:hypothetical protein
MNPYADTKPGPYWVTALEGSSRCFVMSGPYADHQRALDDVIKCRDIAADQDGRAWFMAWGTARMTDRAEPGRLNAAGLHRVSA